MKSIFKLFIAFAALVISVAACEMLNNLTEEEILQNGKHVCKMVFNGSVAGYEGTIVRDVNTKSESSWSDGDVIYITFHNGEEIIPGSAVYSSIDGWTVSYDGELAVGSSQPCEVRFFVNPTFANDNLVNINSNTEIYEDVAGTFNYGEGTVSVTASLTPKVGRIRFTGTSGDIIYVTGITTYSVFSPAVNSFSTTAAPVKLTVQSTGSTPYVYGYFTHEDCKIGIVGSGFAYTRTCSSSIFQTGDSGYMKIPSPSSHNNWRYGLIITVNGVDFKMLSVGGDSSNSYFYTLLAETETTEAQYIAVNGGTQTNSLLPQNNLSWNNWAYYMSKLKNMTSLDFYIPSKNLWQYAASGGAISQGYTYSGSNNPGDVAWYGSNSGNQRHEVKELAPNELGFYDMSGNVSEWSSTPDGHTSNGVSHYYICGGDYSYSAVSVNWTTNAVANVVNAAGCRPCIIFN